MTDWVATGVRKLFDGPHGGVHRWTIDLPTPLADWDVFEYWEASRFDSMAKHLDQGMTLFDVGAEHGWCSVIYATLVGPDNMVLIEPTAEFWPNIRATWSRNFYTRPRACYRGLIGAESTDTTTTDFVNWPAASKGPLIDKNKYEYLHANNDIPVLTIDDLVGNTGVVPDAITIDIEGAELLALRGATETIIDRKPMFWVSVHPDMSERDYGLTDTQLHDFMASLGYKGEHLGTDHEQHWRFW